MVDLPSPALSVKPKRKSTTDFFSILSDISSISSEKTRNNSTHPPDSFLLFTGKESPKQNINH